MRKLGLLTAMAALAVPASAGAVSLHAIGSGFDQPMQVTQPSGGDLLVVEKPGVIRAVDATATTLGTKFLDIRSIVSESGERGLLSIAFPPGYSSNRRFYVNFTNNRGSIEVDEFKRSVGNPNVADRSTRRVVLIVRHPHHENHNGGQLQFDSLGRLYISTGDGGGAGDTEDNARRKTKLLGKILRIDPRRKGSHHYRIPKTNPFRHRFGRNEIFSYGLRNPFRYSLYSPPGAQPRIIIGDVGQGSAEEVDYERLTKASAANFGWPGREGNHTYDATRRGHGKVRKPIFTYSHAGGRCAIIGGEIVHGSNLPTLEGRYLYADLCVGQIRSLKPSIHHSHGDHSIGVSNVAQPSSFGHDSARRYYVTSLGSGPGTGNVYRINP